MVLEHEDLTGRIIGAAIELRRRDIPFERQLAVPVLYHGAEVGFHRLDMLVDDLIVVELKTSKRFADIDFVVVRSYLRAVDREHGLLLNFATSTLDVKRVHAGE